MPHINLLPWREEAASLQKRQYFTVLMAVSSCAFAIVFIISQVYQSMLDGQLSRNQYLTAEIQVLDVRIAKIKTLNEKKLALEKRILVIEELQRSRNVGTQVLDEIAKIVPVGIHLTQLEKQGNNLQLLGKSESNNHLANMIRAIENSDLFTDAILESITSQEASEKLLSDFKMRIHVKGLSGGKNNDAVNTAQGAKP
jgi:type IV pilus assembly protein PilN